VCDDYTQVLVNIDVAIIMSLITIFFSIKNWP